MSSAIDVKEKERAKGKAGDKDAQKSMRPNPVALEAPVSVTWAKPAKADEKRDLFTEETITVLVFKDGAVIQLAGAISIGQLLFLTHKKTNREVVCQVVQKRTFRPTSCYVELEFTEPTDDFWGVSFPSSEEDAQVPAIAEVVAAQAPTEDAESEPVEAPKSEDVAQLKDEIQALRKQLQELKQQQAAEEKPAEEEKQPEEDRDAVARRLAEAEAAARRAAEEEAAARKAAETQVVAQTEPDLVRYEQPAEDMEALAQRLAQAEAAARRAAEEEAAGRGESKADTQTEQPNAQTETPAPQMTESAGESKEITEQATEQPAEQPEAEVAPVRAKIAMRLPSLGASMETPAAPTEAPRIPAAGNRAASAHEDDGLDNLLPKPALDFSKAKPVDPNDPYNIYRLPPKPPGIQEKLLAAGLVLFLIGGGAVAWYMNWLPFLHHETKTRAATKSEPAGAPAEIAKGDSGMNVASATSATSAASVVPKHIESTAPVSPSAAPSVKPAAPAAVSKPTAKPTKESSADDVFDPLGGTPVTTKSVPAAKDPAEAKAGLAKISKNRGKALTSAESKPQPVADVVDSDAPVIPAKLLKSVSPIYPPDAMRQYITGDVRIEAEVDASGHVGAMNVLLGPAGFRQAAMDALKQYEYAPATQGGKPVASKVVVTVKFWFDP